MAGFMERVSEKMKEIQDLANPKEKPSDGMRDEFISDLTRFYEDGTEPSRASADMRYYLHQHEKRLAEKGVKIQRRYTITKDGVKNTRSRVRSPYTVDLSFIECDSSTQYTNTSTQKILKKHKKSASIFYANILNRQDIQDAVGVGLHLSELRPCRHTGDIQQRMSDVRHQIPDEAALPMRRQLLSDVSARE